MNKEPIKKIKHYALFLTGFIVFHLENVLSAWKTLFSVNMLVTKSFNMDLCKNIFIPTFSLKYILTEYKILAWNLFSFDTWKLPILTDWRPLFPLRGHLLIEVLLLQSTFFIVCLQDIWHSIFFIVNYYYYFILQLCWGDIFHQCWKILFTIPSNIFSFFSFEDFH